MHEGPQYYCYECLFPHTCDKPFWPAHLQTMHNQSITRTNLFIALPLHYIFFEFCGTCNDQSQSELHSHTPHVHPAGTLKNSKWSSLIGSWLNHPGVWMDNFLLILFATRGCGEQIVLCSLHIFKFKLGRRSKSITKARWVVLRSARRAWVYNQSRENQVYSYVCLIVCHVTIVVHVRVTVMISAKVILITDGRTPPSNDVLSYVARKPSMNNFGTSAQFLGKLFHSCHTWWVQKYYVGAVVRSLQINRPAFSCVSA